VNQSERSGIGNPQWDGVIARFCAIGLAAVERGLVIASAGNLSARDPATGEIIVTASGSYFDALTRDSFALLSADGTHIDGPKPSSEWRLHHSVYLVRPDATVVMHLHPEFSVMLDEMELPIRQHMLDHVAYVPKIGRVPFFPNGSFALAEAAAEAMRDCDAIVLGHHGCSVLSTDPDDAFRKAQNLEQAARMTYRMAVLGDRHTEFPIDQRATAIHA
jgi:L-fuculose-phosphate aldolase